MEEREKRQAEIEKQTKIREQSSKEMHFKETVRMVSNKQEADRIVSLLKKKFK